MYIKASKLLDNAIRRVIGHGENNPCTYTVKTIFTQSDSEWKFIPEFIDTYGVSSDFINAYMDMRSLSLRIHPQHVLDMLEHAKNLTCTMILTPHDNDTMIPIQDASPLVVQYLATIANSEDLRKQLPVDSYLPNAQDGLDSRHVDAKYEVKLQLLTKVEYNTRHTKLNTIFNDGTNVTQALGWILNAFGIADKEVIPSPNTVSFKNMKIPPVHGLDSIFDYMQERYGIYPKGVGGYFCNDIFYMWQTWDTEIQSPTTLNIYVAPDGSYPGLSCYHILDQDNNIHIVTVTKPGITDLTRNVENQGNIHVEFQSNKTIDFTGKMRADGKLIYSNDHLSIVNPVDDNITAGNAASMNYKGRSSNPFVSASDIAAYQGVKFTCSWTSATLLDILPGMKVIVHFDDEQGIYSTQEGIITGAVVQLQKFKDNGTNKPMYAFDGGLSAFLSPEIKKIVVE